MTTRKPFQIRQGDVFVIAVPSIPEGATPEDREGGRIILAHGEATGHAHAILDREAHTYAAGDDRYLSVGGDGASLVHEEHSTIEIPPGAYRVIRQREYSEEGFRNVAD